jgi:hypothetical protein
MKDLQLVCETIWYEKYEWSNDFNSYLNGFDEIGLCEFVFNNDFMNCLVEYLDKYDKPVCWPCGDKLQDIKATIPYNEPIKFLLDIIV